MIWMVKIKFLNVLYEININKVICKCCNNCKYYLFNWSNDMMLYDDIVISFKCKE